MKWTTDDVLGHSYLVNPSISGTGSAGESAQQRAFDVEAGRADGPTARRRGREGTACCPGKAAVGREEGQLVSSIDLNWGSR